MSHLALLRSAPRILLCIHVGWITGCTGSVDSGPSGPGGPSSPGSPDRTGPGATGRFVCDAAAAVDPGPAPLQRLTPAQYLDSAREVFGADLRLDGLLPAEASSDYVGLAQPDPSQLDVESYGAAARKTAAHVETNIAKFAPCDAATTQAAARQCARTFLERYGVRTYRSPLSELDTTRLLDMFDLGFEGSGYAHGVALMVEAMLQSPRFLYRPEFGDPARATASAVPLSPYELATRLSFTFWNRGPDGQLLRAAAEGALDTPEGVLAQARRLAELPRAHRAFRQFLRTWFGLSDWDAVEKDRKLFPEWSGTTRAAMQDQADALFDAALFGEEGTLDSLFRLDASALSPEGMSAWRSADEEGSAQGVLALPALLSRHAKPNESFPIYRGLFVREQLLCQTLPPPPGDVGQPPTPGDGVSGRDRFAQHSSDPACQGCHTLIDPLGFAFENYDAIGRFRTSDEGHAIDPSGELVGTDVDGPFANLAELSAKLSESETVRSCAARQWFRFAMQRFEQPADGCSMQKLASDFAASGYRFEALRTSIIQSPAFLMRRPIVWEGETP